MTERRASSPARAPASARRSRRRCSPIGWHVIGFDIAPASIEHERFTPVRVDLCDGAATESAAASVGPVAALVHAAGVLRVGPLGKLQAAGRRIDVAPARRVDRAHRKRRASRDGRRARRPRRADRQPRRAGQGRSQPVRRDEGGAHCARPQLGGGGDRGRRHGQRRLARGDRDGDAGRSRAQERIAGATAARPTDSAGRDRGARRRSCFHRTPAPSPDRTSRSAAALRCRANPSDPPTSP